MWFNKDSVVALLLLVCGVGIAMAFVYVPQDRELNGLRERRLTENRKLEKKTELAAIVPKLLRETRAMKAHYKNFDRRLPQQKELGGFLLEISGLLDNENFSDQVIEPGRPTREPLFNTLPIIMKFKGSYLSLGVFLDKINKMERLTRVQRLTINTPANDGGAGPGGKVAAGESDELNIELQLNIYFSAS